MKKQPKKCGTCAHGGDHFTIGKVTYVHCQHPDPKIAGEAGWGTLPEWWSMCPEWKAKPEQAEKTR